MVPAGGTVWGDYGPFRRESLVVGSRMLGAGFEGLWPHSPCVILSASCQRMKLSQQAAWSCNLWQWIWPKGFCTEKKYAPNQIYTEKKPHTDTFSTNWVLFCGQSLCPIVNRGEQPIISCVQVTPPTNASTHLLSHKVSKGKEATTY